MVIPIVIGVAGTHSTGKTTFCEELHEALKTIGISAARVSSLGSQAVSAGVPVLKNHTYSSTCWFIEKTIEAQCDAIANNIVVLVDRPVPDCLAYWHAALESRGECPPEAELTRLHSLVSENLAIYTYLVATRLDHSIPIAAGRDDDECFRRRVDTHLHLVLRKLGATYSELTLSNRQILLSRLVDEINKRRVSS